jgi:hypothetical protein
MLSELVREWLDPSQVLTHLPYALLVLSMMMSDMVWLRTIAIAAGLFRILNRGWINIDHVVVPWEILFVAVNIAQLVIIWYYRKRHRFSEEEQRLADRMPERVERQTIRRILKLGEARGAGPGHVFTPADAPVSELVFVTDGIVQIERAGQILAVCGPGEFVGEMSFLSGAQASADARAVRPVRYVAFNQAKLLTAMNADPGIRHAMDAILNRNLVDKLAKANARHAPAA